MRDEYEPYARPESHVGFIGDGHLMDEYGNVVDAYGQPIGIDGYGEPVIDDYGQYMNGDQYGDMNYEYGNGNIQNYQY